MACDLIMVRVSLFALRKLTLLGPRPTPTHTLSALSTSLEDQPVILSGWLSSQRRASQKLHFFTLRDSSGSVQLICRDQSISEKMMDWTLESVITVEGVVKARKKAKSGEAGQVSSGESTPGRD
jgi:aspartyl-tRNA synthetase